MNQRGGISALDNVGYPLYIVNRAGFVIHEHEAREYRVRIGGKFYRVVIRDAGASWNPRDDETAPLKLFRGFHYGGMLAVRDNDALAAREILGARGAEKGKVIRLCSARREDELSAVKSCEIFHSKRREYRPTRLMDELFSLYPKRVQRRRIAEYVHSLKHFFARFRYQRSCRAVVKIYSVHQSFSFAGRFRANHLKSK